MSDQPAVLVTGFGRCGSTMTMHVLRAGGIPWAGDAAEVSGEQQPPIMFAQGKATKHLLGTAGDASVVGGHGPIVTVWCQRNYQQQAKSTVAFARMFGIPGLGSESALARWLARATPTARMTLRDRGPFVHLDFEAVLHNPRRETVWLALALERWFPNLDLDAMAAAVHDRSPRCNAQLAYERASLDQPEPTVPDDFDPTPDERPGIDTTPTLDEQHARAWAQHVETRSN